MKELTTLAESYAAEKTNKVILTAIAQAYADGYRDGYSDRDKEIPMDLRDNKTEFVDLGLPSGTLWSANYEKEKDGETMYLPYNKASLMSIPTEEQWKELFETCRRRGKSNQYGDLYSMTFIGPNGNNVVFSVGGYKEDNKIVLKSIYGAGSVYFWLLDHENCEDEKKAIRMGREYYEGRSRIDIGITTIFSGYKLPVRLVRTK